MELNSPWHRAVRASSIALTALVVLYAGAPMFTNDAFWHVATGDYLWSVGAFPERDPFSFTATGERWVLHEWLTQVLFFGTHQLAGMHGLRLLTAAAAGLVLWLVARLYRRELSGHGAAALGIVAFVALGLERIQTRPTLLTILAILTLVSLWTRRGRPWRFRDGAVVVAVQLAWSNAHSVALLGPVLYAGFLTGLWIEDRLARRGATAFPAPPAGDLRRHALTLVGCVLATLATPSGPHLWEFAWQDKQTVMQYVDDEWAPFHLVYAQNASLSVSAWLGVLATLAVVLLTWLAVGVALNREPSKLRSRRLPPPTRALLALAFLAGGLMARRFHWLHVFTLLFCLETLLALARDGAFAPLTRALSSRAARAVGAAMTVLAVGALATAKVRVEGQAVPTAVVRSGYWTRGVSKGLQLPGVAFLDEAGIEGDAVCHYGSGGILTYHLFPRVRVLIDSRIDLYRRAIYLDYLAIRNSRLDQQELLDHYGADIYYQHWSLPAPVDRAAWIPVWSGPDGEVLLRRGAPRTAANLLRAERWHAGHELATPR